MMVIGDVRDLSRAGYHWYQEGELDDFEKFIAAISAINVCIALISVGPQAPTGIMAKTGTSILKIAYRTKNLTEPFIKNVIEIATDKTLISTMIEPLKNLCEFAKTKGITATLAVLSRTNSIGDLPRILKSASSLNSDMAMLLKYLFNLIDEFGVSTVKNFAVYGEGAVNLLEKVPAKQLMDDIHIFLKYTGNAFFSMLKLIVNISEWLFPCCLCLCSAFFALLKKGIVANTTKKKALENESSNTQKI